jgi:hypothetical protein
VQHELKTDSFSRAVAPMDFEEGRSPGRPPQKRRREDLPAADTTKGSGPGSRARTVVGKGQGHRASQATPVDTDKHCVRKSRRNGGGGILLSSRLAKTEYLKGY